MRNKNCTDFKNTDVIILCGGQGRRLKAVVGDRPKSMAEINRQPFLDILIGHVSGYGFRRFILCAGFGADSIKRYYKNKRSPHEIIVSDEDKPLGTAGAIKNAQRYIRSNFFLVMNGDSFCAFDLSDFFAFHLEKKALLTIGVVESPAAEDCGFVMLDESQRIVCFEEKRKEKRAFINSGVYLFEREVLSFIPAHTEYSLECEFFPQLVGKEFYGYVTAQELIDIGTPQRYRKAKVFFRKYK